MTCPTLWSADCTVCRQYGPKMGHINQVVIRWFSDDNSGLFNKKSVLQTKYRPLFSKILTKYRPQFSKIQTKILKSLKSNLLKKYDGN